MFRFLCVARVTTALLDKINDNLAKNRKKERKIKEKIKERYICVFLLYATLFSQLLAQQTSTGEGEVPYFCDRTLFKSRRYACSVV